MVVQTTRRVVQNKLLWHFDNLKENETSAEESGTRLPTVNQVELAVHDATKIINKVHEGDGGRENCNADMKRKPLFLVL